MEPASRRRLLSIAIPVGILILVIVAASFLIEEPLRRRAVREMNSRLEGYVVDIRSLDFHPIGFSMDLLGVTVVQEKHPDPPVMSVRKMSASVHWRQLLRARLVGDFLLDRPQVRIDLQKLRKEAKDEKPVKERGWQEALQAVYPLKINLFRVEEGDIVYVDRDPDRPIHVGRLSIRAEDIRNVASKDRVYPSDVRAEGTLFDTGRFSLNGQANFLGDPYPGIRTAFTLDNVQLVPLSPVLARFNLQVKGGVLSAEGVAEYAPTVQRIHLRRLGIRKVKGDYVHSPATAKAEARRKEKVKEAAKEVSNKPGVLVRVDELTVRESDLGFVNQAADPDYRVFLDNTTLTVTNLSNQEREGTSSIRLRGAFMGSGDTEVTAAFRPEKDGPDFDLNVKIEQTQLKSMNDLLRAYGNFDVVSGTFSLYSEVAVRGDRITGYVKPLYKDLKVYDRRQDKEKGLFRKLYEKLIEGVSGLLENRPREQVATKTDISGSVENPKTSTGQIVIRLIQNAFFRAILPGFDEELGAPG